MSWSGSSQEIGVVSGRHPDDWYPGTPADDCSPARDDFIEVGLELEH